jgi:hypothetical protein
MDALFERMKPYIASDTSISGITIKELDARMKQSHDEVISIRDGLNTSITSLSTRLDSISSNMDRQNSIILGMEGQFKETLADFSNKIKELYELMKLTANTTSPPASTSKQVHWGGVIK